MAIAFSDEPRAIFLPKTSLVLTDPEISRKLGISEEVARALKKRRSRHS
jgi:hypothetical protein